MKWFLGLFLTLMAILVMFGGVVNPTASNAQTINPEGFVVHTQAFTADSVYWAVFRALDSRSGQVIANYHVEGLQPNQVVPAGQVAQGIYQDVWIKLGASLQDAEAASATLALRDLAANKAWLAAWIQEEECLHTSSWIAANGYHEEARPGAGWWMQAPIGVPVGTEANWGIEVARQSQCQTPTPYILSNSTSAGPGSTFILTVGNVAPGAVATIAIREPGIPDFRTLSQQAVPTKGVLVFCLYIPTSAAPGTYMLRVTVADGGTPAGRSTTQAVQILDLPLTIASNMPIVNNPPPAGVPVVTLAHQVYVPLVKR